MTEWTKRKYNEYYTSYVPWLEDKYLQWFGENKTSYTAKGEQQLFSLFFFPIQYEPIQLPFLPIFVLFCMYFLSFSRSSPSSHPPTHSQLSQSIKHKKEHQTSTLSLSQQFFLSIYLNK